MVQFDTTPTQSQGQTQYGHHYPTLRSFSWNEITICQGAHVSTPPLLGKRQESATAFRGRQIITLALQSETIHRQTAKVYFIHIKVVLTDENVVVVWFSLVL